MKELIDSILSKSKTIKSLVEENNISRGFLNKHITNDGHFNICKRISVNS